MTVQITKNRCMGCGMCVQSCPYGALDMVDGVAVVDPDKCVDCGACVDVCPASAISPDLQAVPAKAREKGCDPPAALDTAPKAETGAGVWVLIEQEGGSVADVSWELMGAGRNLAAGAGTDLSGVLLGSGVRGRAEEAFAYGADRVYLVDDPLLNNYRTEAYSASLVMLVEKYRPEIVLIGATTQGRDLAGHVATRLETGLTADCTGLKVEEGTGLLLQTRPAFGGNVMATIVCSERRPQMATVRPRVMPMPEKRTGRTGVLVEERISIREEDIPTRVLELTRQKGSAVYLDRAEIIVSGGRGLGSRENFNYVRDLAEALGGTVGASRAAVEAGWIDAAHQVGQTGTTVRPKIYFAIGVSGAIQHLVGMQTSDVIVAVNNDPQAPIFNVATYGIVGDYQVILPILTEAVRRKLGDRDRGEDIGPGKV